MQNWDPALEDLNRLKEIIEANVSTLEKSEKTTFWVYRPCLTMISLYSHRRLVEG